MEYVPDVGEDFEAASFFPNLGLTLDTKPFIVDTQLVLLAESGVEFRTRSAMISSISFKPGFIFLLDKTKWL